MATNGLFSYYNHFALNSTMCNCLNSFCHVSLQVVVNWTLIEGVSRQFQAFREGFDSVFQLSNLSSFYPQEVSMIQQSLILTTNNCFTGMFQFLLSGLSCFTKTLQNGLCVYLCMMTSPQNYLWLNGDHFVCEPTRQFLSCFCF